MQATETTAPPPEPPPALEEPFAPLSAREDRPRWGFTLGCAIAVGLLFLVLGALKGRAPRPETRALSPSSTESAAPDPFADAEPFLPPQNVLPALLSPPSAPRPTLNYKVMQGQVTASGRLPKEVISRILRQNQARLRLCYEAGLRGNPDLQGRVSVRFVIGRDGSMSNISNGGSDLPDADVARCAIRSLYGLSFPQPDSGIVTVTLPIFFRPT
jgi:outer membrane biosynthesis protein TonB